ncbi:Methyltransferase domain protein [Diplonema papillatum]|nr:Methyltransferase domain protein [Diplonema papillatum]
MPLLRPVVSVLDKICNPTGLRVIEYGCGGGKTTRWLLKHRLKAYVGLELQPEFVNLLQSRGQEGVVQHDIRCPWPALGNPDLIIGTLVMSSLDEAGMRAFFVHARAALKDSSRDSRVLVVEYHPHEDHHERSHELAAVVKLATTHAFTVKVVFSDELFYAVDARPRLM